MNRYLIASVGALVAASFAVTAAKADPKPMFPAKVTYPHARALFKKQGWQPYKVPGASGCEFDSCKGFPETLDCGTTGTAPCTFVWKRGPKFLMVTAYGEGVQDSVVGQQCAAVVHNKNGWWDCKK